jgi:hypothetical protein
VVVSFWLARKKRWILSGFVAGLASGTRITGAFLLPALIYEWLLNNKMYRTLVSYHRQKWVKQLTPIGSVILTCPYLYLVPLGLVIYMIYLQFAFSDALYFWHAQSVFGAERTGTSIILPPQVVWRYLKIFFSVSWKNYHFWTAVWEFAAFIFGVATLIVAHKKRVRMSYLLFSWPVLLIPTLTGTFSSLPRYILLLLPIYIILGNIKNTFTKLIILFICVCLQTIFVIDFVRGWWVA